MLGKAQGRVGELSVGPDLVMSVANGFTEHEDLLQILHFPFDTWYPGDISHELKFLSF